MSDLFTPAQKFPHIRPPAKPDATVPPGTGKPVHVCVSCGAPAEFGFGVRLAEGQPGSWFCGVHKGLAG